jgi:hypothetical protein
MALCSPISASRLSTVPDLINYPVIPALEKIYVHMTQFFIMTSQFKSFYILRKGTTFVANSEIHDLKLPLAAMQRSSQSTI